MNTSNLLRTMTCVTTSGGIINERFFTVFEFMKHGGGKEIVNPMKFINVVDDA